MPVCYKCGQVLSTKQALEYHVNSSKCVGSKKENVKYDVCMICDWKGTIIDITNEHSNIYGYDINEMIGKSEYDFIYYKDKEYLYKNHIINERNKTISVIYYRRVNKNNKIIPVMKFGEYTKNGLFINNFEKIIRSLTDKPSLIIIDLDGIISYVNDSFINEYGYIYEEITKLNIRDITDKSSIERLTENMLKLLNGKICEFEIVHLKFDKTKVLASSKCEYKGNFIIYYSKILHNVP